MYLLKKINLGLIKVTNIRIYDYHGCLIDEGKIGGDDIRELPSGVMVVCVNSLLKARVRPRKRVRK